MKNQDIYDAWMKHKESVEVSNGFPDEVMRRVRGYDGRKSASLLNMQMLDEFILSRRWARVAVLIIGAAGGASRDGGPYRLFRMTLQGDKRWQI